MKAFTIENETNNITLHATIQDAEAVANAEHFRNEAGLAKLAANWPAARLVEIWNSLPGETQVKKFKDRATAVNRIWKAIQSLGPAAMAAEEPAPVPETAPAAELPETAHVSDQETSEIAQPKAVISENPETTPDTAVAPQTPDVAPEQAPATKKATRARKAPVAATNASAPREGSKTSQVIAMLKREGGVTLEEIMTAMGWQKHTTRAMMSAGGSLTKKHGLVITSEKVGDQRKYFIKA
jgi:outer membrane biosynthesis protein TonB